MSEEKRGERLKLLGELVQDAHITPNMSVAGLLEEYSKMGGFMARHLSDSFKVLCEMLSDSESTNFLSFTADLVSTGLRGVLAQLVGSGLFKVVITTCGTLDHDIARSLGARYSFGSFDSDDVELRGLGISRLGNIFIPVEDYGALTEKFVHSTLAEAGAAAKREWGVRELIDLFASKLPIDENSILRAAHTAGVKVYVPGFVDGAVGTHVFTFSQTHSFTLNILRDMSELSDIVFDSKRTGALIIGGGISKHHTIWWNQFKDGLDYAVYLTTASEYDGSLSGARPKEAISWNKIKPTSKHAVVIGDATITLPLLVAALPEKIGVRLKRTH
ncbi:deoxyhypusine synthase [Candidatus Marsarchaeota G2 archaeon OSP_D]|uniref:Probable deoxyhypusine synthase n=1 Tax=Candidatus Marsarchaeota G2 archaeon OSP_D TaxID=1978157 RepID=A0A2R6AY76_9ARCH|nr:MAG: deoxyhypusine synthase [Candidatus Marsarchaeota G2 archaeon OSP_D]